MTPDPSLDALIGSLGRPERVEVTLRPRELFDPIWKTDRRGEVAFVLLRPDDSIWLMSKTFYPAGTFRVPTGGIGPREQVADALARETLEETGWRLPPARFLVTIRYRFEARNGDDAHFETHAFLLRCGEERPESQDEDERILEWRTVSRSDLTAVAHALARLPEVKEEGVGYWSDYGAFRAVVHGAVAASLERG